MSLGDFEAALRSKINPVLPDTGTSRPSAVLVIIYGSVPHILMTKKSSRLRMHAGEIAFPGGKKEPGDADLLDTALRETREEVCLEVPRSRVIGQLDPVTTLNSNFTIIPFVCTLDSLPSLASNTEVEQILHMPAYPLLRTLRDDPDPGHNSILEMYTFTFEGHVIWGASARMLKQVHDRLSGISYY